MSKLRTLKQSWRVDKLNTVDLVLGQIDQLLCPASVEDCVSGSTPSENRVLLSYLTDPFRSLPRIPRINGTPRANKWKAGAIARAFANRGFTVDAYRFDCDTEPVDYSEYEAVFGIEPNFGRFAQAVSEDATNIYYATGMHWSQRNQVIKRRLDDIEEKKGARPTPVRLLPETSAEEKADAIVVIGDEVTANTYTNYLGDVPTYQVNPTSHEFLSFNPEERDYGEARTNFLWFSGGGLFTKGLDVVLETVQDYEELDLYVCGPIGTATEFADLYWEELFQSDNIHPIGWVDVGSKRFEELTATCGYIILPSVSEGFPESIADAMKRGLVPLITPEVIRDPGSWGFQIPSCEPEGVKETIDRAILIDPEELRERSLEANMKAVEDFTRERYSRRIREILEQVL